MGIAPVIHHTAISVATAATRTPSGAIPAGIGSNRIRRNREGPSSKPGTECGLRKIQLTVVIGIVTP